MKIGILTSSRADYGIYKPLLDKVKEDTRFDLTVIAFGMHLQAEHGNTLKVIERDGYKKVDIVEGMSDGDAPKDIVVGYGNLVSEFAAYWEANSFDWVFALGDRFEMSAAVQSGIPYLINFAHIHGGETTLGAIDNIYRHQISLASKLHFVAAIDFKKKLTQLLGASEHIYNVGSLSLDNLDIRNLPLWPAVRNNFQIPAGDFVLVTFHPETVDYKENAAFAKTVETVLETISKETHVVITLANADTMGKLFRDMAQRIKSTLPSQISVVPNFGKDNYFAAMNACKYMLGNTSSGIIEAASFSKFVINVGDRQKGRLRSANVIDTAFDKFEILHAVEEIERQPIYNGQNAYKKENSAAQIIQKLVHETI